MNCPQDNQKLTPFDYKGVKLHICPKDNGLWFDKGELQKAKDAKDEYIRWVDPDLWKDKGKFRISASARLCPRDQVPLYETQYEPSEIKVDVCTVCEGVWLDKGEFDKIVNYLRDKVSRETISGYLKNIGEEAVEVFTGPEGFAAEAKDLLMVMKLLTYRIGVQFPLLKEIIRHLPK